MEKAFTLVELLVVVGIISILTSSSIVYFRIGQKNYALQRSAQILASTIREAQEMAASAKRMGNILPKGYGVYLKTFPDQKIILFGDLNGNNTYQPQEKIKEIDLEKGIEIYSISPNSPLNIVFKPPLATVLIENNPNISQAQIKIRVKDGNFEKTIKVNRAGLIAIE